MIYFIQDTGSYYIKVGFTASLGVEERMRVLQTACPFGLVLLATFPGSRDDETMLHEKFADIRVHGEWFKPAPELIQFILRQTQPPHDGFSCKCTQFNTPLNTYQSGKPRLRKKRDVVAATWLEELFANVTELPSREVFTKAKAGTTLSINALIEGKDKIGIRSRKTANSQGGQCWVWFWTPDARDRWMSCKSTDGFVIDGLNRQERNDCVK